MLVLTVVPSIVVALVQHSGAFGFLHVALLAEAIVHGQVWRLATWTFFESQPISLIFAVFFLWWLGRDLVGRLGDRGFLYAYGAIAISTAVVVTAVGLADAGVSRFPYLGTWPVAAGLTIVWGSLFPDRTIRVYLVLPIRGSWMTAFTVGATILVGIYYGWRVVLPDLVAEALTIGYLRAGSLRTAFAKGRSVRREAAVKAKRRAARGSLRLVESMDDEPPPLPKDVEKQLGDLFDPKRKR